MAQTLMRDPTPDWMKAPEPVRTPVVSDFGGVTFRDELPAEVPVYVHGMGTVGTAEEGSGRLKLARMLATIIGADSPTSQVLMLMNPLAAGAEGGIVGGLQRALKLYHNSPDVFPAGKPDFDAFLGTDDFRKAFTNEWGPHTYEVTVPKGSRVLNVAADTPDAVRLRAAMAKRTWPNDTVDTFDPDDLYEMWTDKQTVMGALDDTGLREAYDLVQNDMEYIAPAEFLSRVPGRRVVDQPIKAYHGSPHEFAPEPGAPLGRFRGDKIGTGEGAQAYGHGLYFAEKEGTARSYRDALSDPARVRVNQAGNQDPQQLAIPLFRSLGKRNGASQARKLAESFPGQRDAYLKAADIIENGDPFAAVSPGKMYEVNIHADPEDFLDWDKPLSEQSERVRGAIESSVPQAREPMVMVGDKPFHEWAAPGMKAGENITPRDVARVKVKNAVSRAGGNVLDAERLLHSELGEGGAPEFRQSIADLFNGLREVQDSVHTVPSGVDMRMRPSELARGSKLFTPESAAASMREAGIPGIKYLDQGSRAAGEGTRNYVVFPGNEHLIEIMKKYGVTLPVAGQILDEMRQSMTPMTSHESD